MSAEKKLTFRFKGRVLEHLGLQLYQKPDAALAEMVANAWDADAVNVKIAWQTAEGKAVSSISVSDDGCGMTFEECEERFLVVGFAKRGRMPTLLTPGGRTVLGRKGIGKLAGFGIAKKIKVTTTSKATGEKTIFEMDLDALMGDEYLADSPAEIKVIEYLPPDPNRRSEAGTLLELTDVQLDAGVDLAQVALGLARRFVRQQSGSEFNITVNGESLPPAFDPSEVEFRFPEVSTDSCKVDSDGWGTETVAGHEIKWRFFFFDEPISDHDLRGVVVYAGGKLIQSPFLFNISGGISAQQGVEYMFGQVQADFIDAFAKDPISPERQRANWDSPTLQPLRDWGQGKIKETTGEWKRRRAEKRQQELEDKVEGFGSRLERLPTHERKTVKKALLKLASISTIPKKRFKEMGEALLTAWEQGRLRELISKLEGMNDPTEADLIDVLTETDILTNLHLAEIVRTKLEAVQTLRREVAKKQFENKLRDHIAESPYLLSPKFETFARETKVTNILREASENARLTDEVYNGRLDLALSAGRDLLVVEFMRPGLKLDYDHCSRIQKYISIVRERVRSNTALGFDSVEGLVVADDLSKEEGMAEMIAMLRGGQVQVFDWSTLLDVAEHQWKDFGIAIVARSPKDPRIDDWVPGS